MADYISTAGKVLTQPSVPIEVTSTVNITATTIAPTKGNTTNDHISIVDDGSGWCKLFMIYRQATAGTGGLGEYLFELPGGYAFDSDTHAFSTGNQFLTETVDSVLPFSDGVVSNAYDTRKTVMTARDSRHFKLNHAGVGLNNNDGWVRFAIHSGYLYMGAMVLYTASFTFKKA